MRFKRNVRMLFSGLIVFVAVFAAILFLVGQIPWALSQKKMAQQTQKKGFAELVVPTPTPTPKPLLPPLVYGEKNFKVPVLLYHYIGLNPNKDDTARDGLSTAPDVFDEQLALLQKNGFVAITLDTLAAAFEGKTIIPEKSVVITFDDAYMDFYFNAYPILEKYKMTGTVFVPTGLVGGDGKMYMTWPQIEELSRSPYVIFGSHTVHHYYLSKSSPEVLTYELIQSKRTLETHVNYTVNWFAYPYGAFNDDVVSATKQAGYVGAVTTLANSWQYKSRFYYIPRIKPGSSIGASFLRLLN